MTATAGPATLPACFEFSAPVAWQAVDFISDLHLCEARPATFRAWERHLRHTTADAVFMLGDLFDVWVGDDARSCPFERRCAEVLAEAAGRRQLGFMAGNRDFLVGATLLRETGVMALPDPTLLSAWGQTLLLSHGDALCLADLPYQAFRREVRSPAWQADFGARPLDERLALAAQMRGHSAARQRVDGDLRLDIDFATALAWLRGLGAEALVHGHTHRPGSGALAPGLQRHVLSDWDLDTAARAEVLRLSRQGFERLPPSGARYA